MRECAPSSHLCSMARRVRGSRRRRRRSESRVGKGAHAPCPCCRASTRLFLGVGNRLTLRDTPPFFLLLTSLVSIASQCYDTRNDTLTQIVFDLTPASSECRSGPLVCQSVALQKGGEIVG